MPPTMDVKSFKVRFMDGNFSRFSLPCDVTWGSFLDLLEEEIFKGAFHKELLLEYTSENGSITITNEEEWDAFMAQQIDIPLIKFQVVEGSGVYFKDGPPPVPVEFYSTSPTIYKIEIQYPDEDLWYPFKQLSISCDGEVFLGSDPIHNVSVEDSFISWSSNDNTCTANITLSDDKQSFSGSLAYPNQDCNLIRGQEVGDGVSNTRKDTLAIAVPSCLSAFFPSGKVLPYHLPKCLEKAVRVVEVPGKNYEVDLDIDIKKLCFVTHNRAIELLKEQNYSEAEKFFLCAEEMAPQSPVIQYNIGCLHALRNEKEKALHALQQALQYGYNNPKGMSSDPDLISLHQTSAFWDIIDAMHAED